MDNMKTGIKRITLTYKKWRTLQKDVDTHDEEDVSASFIMHRAL